MPCVYVVGGVARRALGRTWPRLVCRKRDISTCVNLSYSSRPSTMQSSLCKTIRYSGPISIAEYMRTVLTNSNTGYYIHKDMLGAQGDFVTSPELNQMFGELLGIWFITEWQALGSPSNIRFVELGPGRGTLANDIVKTFKHFRQKIFGQSRITFHFVEVSESLSKIQYETLCGNRSKNKNHGNECFQEGQSKLGNFPMYWHRDIENVPNDTFTFFLAHEFFDALPIHKFVKGKNGWREIYIDAKSETEDKLHFIQLPEITLATKLIRTDEKRNHLEICPQAGSIVSNIAKRVKSQGGGALIIDYGHLGDKEDTLRGFKDHKLNDVLENIGEADLTADVDFQFLQDSITEYEVQTSGPIIQQDFLKNMGIEIRLMMLLRNCKSKPQAQKLIDSYKIIMDEKHMGERFKVMAITTKNRPAIVPVTGFYDK